MRKHRLYTLVVSIIMLFAFSATCLAATTTTTPAKKPVPAKKVVTPVKKVPAKPAVKPVAKPAVVKPAVPVAIPVPAGFTGDKAAAFSLLAKGKYSGKATGDFKADLKSIILIGDKTMYVTTKSTGTATLAASKDVPGIAGGDFKDKKETLVPYIELAGGNAKSIEAYLKEAKVVKVAGNVITITNSKPPTSLLNILNSVSSKVKWMKNR
ncbi:MAG: hypothetical protein ACM3QW_03055, partial [Ignavibacteriales bacterium]